MKDRRLMEQELQEKQNQSLAMVAPSAEKYQKEVISPIFAGKNVHVYAIEDLKAAVMLGCLHSLMHLYNIASTNIDDNKEALQFIITLFNPLLSKSQSDDEVKLFQLFVEHVALVTKPDIQYIKEVFYQAAHPSTISVLYQDTQALFDESYGKLASDGSGCSDAYYHSELEKYDSYYPRHCPWLIFKNPYKLNIQQTIIDNLVNQLQSYIASRSNVFSLLFRSSTLCQKKVVNARCVINRLNGGKITSVGSFRVLTLP